MSSSEKFASGLNKWAPTDKPMRVDFNRDNEIVDAFMQQATSGNMTVHVATNGSDTEGNGSEGRPYRTIQKAIDTVPKMILHAVIIKIAQGTYNEYLYVTGFFGGGYLTLEGGVDTNAAVDYKIKGLVLQYCSCTVHVKGLEGTFSNVNGSAFEANACSGAVVFLNCRAALNSAVAGSKAFSGSSSPTVQCQKCVSTGFAYGFWATSIAKIMVVECSDNSSEYSYVAVYGGAISDCYGNTVTNKFSVHSGGIVIRNKQVTV